jgi:hypothetical protein
MTRVIAWKGEVGKNPEYVVMEQPTYNEAILLAAEILKSSEWNGVYVF